MSQQKSLFNNAAIISVYTDDDAVVDGILVAINDRDRVTRTVFEWLSEAMESKKDPPSCWPVDLFAFCRANDGAGRALAMTRALIDVHRKKAAHIYNENIGGGIFQLFAKIDIMERPIALEEDGELNPKAASKELWLLPNESERHGGLTLMFPSDY